MILTVGICDDCSEHADLLEKYISGYQVENKLRIIKSTDPQRFLQIAQEEKLRLVFLDIDMNRMDGIELGKKIKAMDADTVIIYVTAHEKYALEAFRVRAFHYLVKPVTKEKVSAVLTEAMAFIRRTGRTDTGKVFTVRRKGETVSLRMDDIACFEKTGHKIRVHAAGRIEEYYDNFVRLIDLIDKDNFIQCHQGYIVNVTKIRAFRDKTLFLEGGLEVPVSRTFSEKVREALSKRLFAGKDEA